MGRNPDAEVGYLPQRVVKYPRRHSANGSKG